MKRCMKDRLLAVASLLFAGSILAFSPSVRAAETLTITGSGAGVGTMQLMAQEFNKKNPDVKINVLPSIGSSGAIKAIKAGKIDIGVTARPLKEEERSEKVGDKVVQQLTEESYGRTAFIFGVQDTNTTTGFTLAEIAEIYAGTRMDWTDKTPMRLVIRPASDSFTAYLEGISPAMKAASEKSRAIPGVFVGITDQDAAAQIEKTPGSLGATSASLVASEKRKIKALSVDGTAPTLDNVAAGKYPYFIKMYLVYKPDKYNGALKDFVEFVYSENGQKILKDTEHVTVARNTGK